MKQTLFIPLIFSASPVTTQVVNVPFKVSKIHVKSAGYNADDLGWEGYAVITASFAPDRPLAIVNQDTTYSYNTSTDTEIKLNNPQVIQGNYTFELRTLKNTMGTTSNFGDGIDSCGLIIEFNSEEEIN